MRYSDSRLCIGVRLLSFACCFCATALFGETLTWCGPDGGAWSTADNWTNSRGEAAIPANGDYVVIPSRETAMTLENDIEGLTLKRIAFTGSGKSVTLTGNAYTLDNPGYYGQSTSDLAQWPFVVEGCIVTNEPPLTMKNSASVNRYFGIYSAKKLTFVSDVTGNDITKRIYTDATGSSCRIDFLGQLTATNATLWGRSNLAVYFYSPIHVKGVWYPDVPSWASWNLYFNASGNVVKNLAVGAGGGFYMYAKNDCMQDDTVLWWDYGTTTSRNGCFYIGPGQSGNVVIDHVEATDPAKLYVNGTFNDNAYKVYGYSGTLTMRGSQDVLSYARFTQYVDLVWDPLDDYTLDLRDRTHDLKSSCGITVRRGRMALSGMTRVTGATKLTLGDNTVFDIACTNDIAMPGVTTLTMGFGSRLYITNATVQAFTANAPTLTIKDGAYIEIGDGAVAPTFKKVTTAYGVPVAAGSYTGADGVAGATKVPWLRGSAVVTVSESSFPASGDNYWKTAVSGDWSDASKWSLGVPTSSQIVHIAAQGADYTVTVTGSVSFANSLYVSGSPYSGHKTTFSADGSFKLTQRVYLEDGAVLDTPTGGVFQLNSYYDPSISIAGGAELRVSGGLCNFTNDAVRRASIAGTSAKTATVSVVSGCLQLYSNIYQLNLGDYAHLNVSGGELLFDDGRGNLTVYEHVKTSPNSLISVSGSGRVRVTHVMSGQIYGSGTTEFSGHASYWSQNRQPPLNYPTYTVAALLGVRADVGETAEWNIRDHAFLEFGYSDYFYVGNTSKDYGSSRSIVRFLSDADHGTTTNGGCKMVFGANDFPRIAGYMQVGCGSGYGELDLANGSIPLGEYGLRIGSCDNFGKTPQPIETVGCTGLVHVTGGKLICKGAAWKSEALVPPAFLVGWGWPTLATEGRPYNGFVNISGGAVSNQCHLVLGMNLGYGEWRQSGGDTVQCKMNTGLMIGVAGGKGLLALSGGTFSAQNAVYVGGAPASAFCNSQFMLDNGYPSDRHDATGVLSISGGSFIAYGDASPTVYVGKDGDGTIEMDGASGSFTANALELAAGVVDGAQTHATLRFKLDADGNVSPVNVNSTLKISSGSALVVDATACSQVSYGVVNLVSARSVVGDFDPADISIIGAPSVVSQMAVRWRGTKLALRRGECGMILICR